MNTIGVNNIYMPITGCGYPAFPATGLDVARLMQTPRYSVFDNNVFGYTPATNYCATPMLGYTTPNAFLQPFDFMYNFFTSPFGFMPQINGCGCGLFGGMTGLNTIAPMPFMPIINTPQQQMPSLLNITSNRNSGAASTASTTSTSGSSGNSGASRSSSSSGASNPQRSTRSYAPVQHVSSGIMDINNVSEHFINKYGVTEKTMPDGTKVLACRWSKFAKAQPEWVELQHAMLRAAKDLGLTLVYSDVTRTIAASNAGRAKKGDLVCRGGESPHNYGVAADIVLFQNGKEVNVNSETMTAFARKAQEYSNGRIEWGGDWRKKGERHHFNIKGWEKTYKRSEYLVG